MADIVDFIALSITLCITFGATLGFGGMAASSFASFVNETGALWRGIAFLGFLMSSLATITFAVFLYVLVATNVSH